MPCVLELEKLSLGEFTGRPVFSLWIFILCKFPTAENKLSRITVFLSPLKSGLFMSG